MSFILKKYKVGVAGYGDAFFYAKNKNQARMRAFRSLQSANSRITFKRFLQICAFIEQQPSPPDFGKEIEVQGRKAYFVDYPGGNSVSFCWPDDDRILCSHELDVTGQP